MKILRFAQLRQWCKRGTMTVYNNFLEVIKNMRTPMTVYLTEQNRIRLEQESERTGTAKSALVNHALANFLTVKKHDANLHLEDARLADLEKVV